MEQISSRSHAHRAAPDTALTFRSRHQVVVQEVSMAFAGSVWTCLTHDVRASHIRHVCVRSWTMGELLHIMVYHMLKLGNQDQESCAQAGKTGCIAWYQLDEDSNGMIQQGAT